MADLSSGSVPELFHGGHARQALAPRRASRDRRRRSLRVGQPSILLSATNAQGAGVALAFTRARGGVASWRSLSPGVSGLERAATFPCPLTPHALSRLLASGAVRPAVDTNLIGETWIDGVEGPPADRLRLAWCRRDGRVDPRTVAILPLSDQALSDTCDRLGLEGADDLLGLGADVLAANARFLARHRSAIDAEVDRRAVETSAGEEQRRELRAFVEGCLLALGRLPRGNESAGCWDGAGLDGRDLGDRERRRLGLLQTSRVGRFHVWVRFWTAAESFGRGEFGSGPGWYWDVTNPDPLWIMSGTMGPCGTARDAWSEARNLEEPG